MGIKKFQYNSPVILTFTLISFLALILGNITDGESTYRLFSVYRSSPKDPLGYIRVFTHCLGHSNFSHFFNNFILILLVGPTAEEKYGSRRLLYMMLVTAFVTGIIHIIFFDTILLGASGIVFFLIILSSYSNYQKGRIPLTLVLVVVIFIGREVYDIIFSNDNISQFTHIIGAIIGLIYGYVLNERKKRHLRSESANIQNTNKRLDDTTKNTLPKSIGNNLKDSGKIRKHYDKEV